MHHLIDRLNHFLALANMLLAMIFPFLLEIIGGSLKVCKVASGLFCTYETPLFHCGWFPLTRFWLRLLTHVNFNQVNKIEARQKVLSLNKESARGSTFFFFFFFNSIYSINNQQSKILTNATILTPLTIQYLEYNRLRYLLCLQCKDLQYSVLTTLPTHYSHYNALFTSSSN